MDLRITGAEDVAAHAKMLVVGTPGSGKTRLASTAPGVLYLDAEGRLMSVADRRIPALKITSLRDMEDAVTLLRDNPGDLEERMGRKIETVVVDTVDEIQRIMQRDRCKERRIEIFEMDDWQWMNNELRGFLKAVVDLDFHIILNVHAYANRDEQYGRVWIIPELQGRMSNEITEMVDIAVALKSRVVNTNGDRQVVRYIQAHPDPNHEWIKDHTATLPIEVEMNFEDDLTTLFKSMGERAENVEAGESFQVSAPTPEPEPPEEQPKRKAQPKKSEPDQGELLANLPGGEEKTLTLKCEVCEEDLPEEQARLSQIRLRKELCPKHLREEKLRAKE